MDKGDTLVWCTAWLSSAGAIAAVVAGITIGTNRANDRYYHAVEVCAHEHGTWVHPVGCINTNH